MSMYGPRHWGNRSKPESNAEVFEEEESEERISVWDAAEMWASNGKDEDYMFGYTEDELENAL